MNYYSEIKNELINNEITKKIKDYGKNKSDLMTYYNVGKLLFEAGKHYGEGIIKEYSLKLTNELGKGYTFTALTRMKKFYLLAQKLATLSQQLSYGHYVELLPINNLTEINYYIMISEQYNLSIRKLRQRIKSNEYERLSEETKLKLQSKEKTVIQDFIKNPIIIKSVLDINNVSEKILKELILEDIESFLNELGNGFSFIASEYKIKIGDNNNYIDILLFNYIFNAFVVVELKVTELKKEYIGQVEVYMNYIDKNVKTTYQDKTIGLIIVRKENKYIIEYSSDKRIFETTYLLKDN